MFDPYNPLELRQLEKAVRAAHLKLQCHRDARRELVREYVGAAYGRNLSDSTEPTEMPVNMLSLMVDVYLMYLAGESPQVLLLTPRKDLLPYVADLESIVNQELREMNFDKTLRRWVLDAIFGIGVLKCGLVDADYIEVIPGQPQPSQDYFADVVDFDDFVYDTDASSWDRITFIGDRYKVDYDALMSSESFDEAGKHSLRVREENLADEDERVSSFAVEQVSEFAEDNSFRRTAWVWDVCLPEEGLVITFADNANDSLVAPLKVVQWDSVTNSPYHALYFSDVPGNAMPLPPGQIIKSLNKALNALYRKLVDQAKRQKRVALFRHGEEDDADRIRNAADGEMVPVDHPDTVKEVVFGGPVAESLAFAIHAKETFSYVAGNIDAMGGLGPQSATVGQDQMIAQTVSRKSARMTRHVVDATADVVREFVYRLWNDPINSYSAMRPIANTSVQVHAQLVPDVRHGQFSDFSISVEPYSMQYKSPQQRSSDILQLMTQVVFPLMPFLQQQGIGINTQHLFELLSKYMSLPELASIFEFVGVPMPGSGGESPTQPQVSHRTYERVNRPGATRQGNDRTMQQLLSGGNPQQSQVAALGRAAGV